MTEQVILVDEQDNELGSMEKLEAHQTGALHRAFSVLLFNSNNEILLQKRSESKYHSPGLWTNTCCSHPKPGEPIALTVHRRLVEEMGIKTFPHYAFKFQYKAFLNNNLIEHELDHVYIGHFEGEPQINPQEVSDWKYSNIQTIQNDIKANPDNYTKWFNLILERSELKQILSIQRV